MKHYLRKCNRDRDMIVEFKQERVRFRLEKKCERKHNIGLMFKRIRKLLVRTNKIKTREAHKLSAQWSEEG